VLERALRVGVALLELFVDALGAALAVTEAGAARVD